MTDTQFFTKQRTAINQAIQDSKKGKSGLVISVHGYGYRIVSIEFQINRLYYHGEGGQKMFFTPIAYVPDHIVPGNPVNYIHSHKDVTT